MFNCININVGIDELLVCFVLILECVCVDGVKVCGYVFIVLGCLYQGEVLVSEVVCVVIVLYVMGCYEILLGDIIGVGILCKVCVMLYVVVAELLMLVFVVYFYDIYGQVLVNIDVCLDEGVCVVDFVVFGVGGCLYVKGVSGNVVSEDVVYLLYGIGMCIGIDLLVLVVIGCWLVVWLGCDIGSKIGKVLVVI